MAFAQLEPFGFEADSIGSAITSSTVANVNRGKNQKAYKPEDFMPKFEKGQQTPAQMLQIAEAFTYSLGGQDLRDDG